MPNTPGSTNGREEIAGMGAASGIGDPARTAAARRRQRINQEQETPTNPIAHTNPMTSAMTSGTRFGAGCAGGTGAANVVPANGWVISSTTMTTLAGPGTATAAQWT